MIITKQIEIDIAHRVHNNLEKYKNIHGHRLTIECGISGDIEKKSGFIIDFSIIKESLESVIKDKFDHSSIFYNKDPLKPLLEKIANSGELNKDKIHFLPFIPTSENLCSYWYNLLDNDIKKINPLKLEYLKVWTNPNNTVCYSR